MRKLSIIMLALVLVLGFPQAAFSGPTFSGTFLTNIAIITAQNSAITPSDFTNLTTATMWGGTIGLDSTVVQTIPNFGSFTWAFSITNHGNVSVNYSASVIASNGWTGGGIWGRRFENLANLNGVGPGGNATINFVISNKTAASNRAYVSYLVQISNISANLSAHAYYGADGATWYGGNLGIATNSDMTNAVGAGDGGPIVYWQQAASTLGDTNKAGFVTAIIGAPDLRISKYIPAGGIIHPAGLGISGNWVEPGAYITYYISVTNNGAMATNVKIVDTFSTNFELVAITNGADFVSNSFTTSGSMNILTFTNGAFRITDGTDLIKIKVKVK